MLDHTPMPGSTDRAVRITGFRLSSKVLEPGDWRQTHDSSTAAHVASGLILKIRRNASSRGPAAINVELGPRH